MDRQLVVCDNLKELGRRSAELFVTLATGAVTSRGRFSVALSGGETPKAMHSQLQSDAYVSRVPWSGVYVFWGDERYVPHDHPDSNYGMARSTLLDQVPIPDENIFSVPTGTSNSTRGNESGAGSIVWTLAVAGTSPCCTVAQPDRSVTVIARKYHWVAFISL